SPSWLGHVPARKCDDRNRLLSTTKSLKCRYKNYWHKTLKMSGLTAFSPGPQQAICKPGVSRGRLNLDETRRSRWTWGVSCVRGGPPTVASRSRRQLNLLHDISHVACA